MSRVIEYIGVPNTRFSINGKTFMTDENGYVKIDMNEIAEDRSLYEFDRLLDDYFTRDQKIAFYRLLMSSNKLVVRVGVKDIVAVTDCDKVVVRNIIIPLALKHGVLLKYETQWNTNNDIRPQILALLKSLENSHSSTVSSTPESLISDALSDIQEEKVTRKRKGKVRKHENSNVSLSKS